MTQISQKSGLSMNHELIIGYGGLAGVLIAAILMDGFSKDGDGKSGHAPPNPAAASIHARLLAPFRRRPYLNHENTG